MRNTIYTLLILVLLFSSCQNGKDKDEKKDAKIALADTLNYTYDSIKVYSKHIPKGSQSFRDTTKSSISYPVFKNNTLNEFIKRNVFDFFAKEEPATSYQDLMNSFINGYDDFVKSNPDTHQSWFLMININVIKQTSNYIALKYVHTDYAGGAHGNSVTSFLNYNPKTNAVITLDSLIQEGKMEALISIAEGIFRKNEKLTANEPLTEKYFFDKGKFSLAQSFYVSDKGLVFLYNPYEIKAYVEGYTELIVPYSALKSIAKSQTILTTHL